MRKIWSRGTAFWTCRNSRVLEPWGRGTDFWRVWDFLLSLLPNLGLSFYRRFNMSNIAVQTTTLTNARAVGSINPQTGFQHGGIYYPAYMKNGLPKPARWEGNIALNGKPYYNAAGEKVDGKATFMRLVVWNGKNVEVGRGLADTFAKCVSVGKEISCNVRIESFDKRIFLNGQPILDAQGNAVTHQAHNFIFEDKLIFGADSNKVIGEETLRWNGAATFDSRPPMWNVLGHADQIAWSKTVVPARMNAVYNGGGDYGYARVIVPEGVQVITPQGNVQPNTVQAGPAQMSPTLPNTTQNGTVVPQGALPTTAAQTLQMPAQAGAAAAAVNMGASTPL